MSWPVNESDPIPRNDIITMKKLIAVEKLEESKTVLGWIINTRNLMISLPVAVDKHSSAPSQVPFGLKINPLPKEIVSWLTSLLLYLLKKTQWSNQPMQSEFSLGLGIPST